jgi:hypothetical protein
VNYTFNQWHRESVGDRCDETDPQRRESRSENWHRDNQAVEAADAREFLHHSLEADRGGTDVVDAGGFSVEGGHEIGEDVPDRDRLDLVEDPFRRDHRRQPLGQVADHLEGCRARADDRSGAELGGRETLAQDLSDLGPTRQVFRDVLRLGQQSAEVDDVAKVPPRGHEVFCRPPVAEGEVSSRAHEVDQVIRRINAIDGRWQRFRFLDVALHHLHRRRPRTTRYSGGVAYHYADVLPVLQQAGHQPASDITGGTCDQNLHRFLPP